MFQPFIKIRFRPQGIAYDKDIYIRPEHVVYLVVPPTDDDLCELTIFAGTGILTIYPIREDALMLSKLLVEKDQLTG